MERKWGEFTKMGGEGLSGVGKVLGLILDVLNLEHLGIRNADFYKQRGQKSRRFTLVCEMGVKVTFAKIYDNYNIKAPVNLRLQGLTILKDYIY